MIPIRKIEVSGKMARAWIKVGRHYETADIEHLEMALHRLDGEKANGFTGYIEHLNEEELNFLKGDKNVS